MIGSLAMSIWTQRIDENDCSQYMISVNWITHFMIPNLRERKLMWAPTLSNTDIVLNFASKKYTVSIGLIPMSLLLSFNRQEKITVKDLLELTHLSD